MGLAPALYIPVGATLYVDAANAGNNGVRGRADKPFATIAQANAASQSGDTIHVVGNGTYNEKNIAKTGRKYIIDAGVTVSYTGNGAGGLIDDTSLGQNGALITQVYCYGEMLNAGGTQGTNNVVTCSNDGSDIYLFCRYAEVTNSGLGGNENSVVRQAGGRCITDFIEAVGDTTVFWWNSGDGFITCRYARDRVGGATLYPADTGSTAGDTLDKTWRSGEWYVTVDYLSASGAAYRAFGLSNSARIWVNFKQIDANGVALGNGYSGTIVCETCKSYFIGEKISNVGATDQNDHTVWMSGSSGAELYLDVQKLAGAKNHVLYVTGGKVFANIHRLEDTADGSYDFPAAANVSGGEGTIIIDDLESTAQHGLLFGGGTVKVKANVRATTGKSPLWITAQGPVLYDSKLTAASGQPSVKADSALNLNVEGVNEVNAAPSSNVTLKGSGSLGGGTLAGSSGTMSGFSLNPTVNQSGTAGYTAFRLNSTHSATGSGTKRLMDLLQGGSSKFSVSHLGDVAVAGTLSVAASVQFDDDLGVNNINCNGDVNSVGGAFNGDGSGLTALNGSNVSSGTIANARTTATSANTASAIVARDGSGNFTAGTITATTFTGTVQPFIFEGVLASDATTAADTTPVNATGLVFTFSANKNYWVEVFGTANSQGTGNGFGLQLDVSVAVTQVAMTHLHVLGSTAQTTGGYSLADDTTTTPSTGVPSTSTDIPFLCSGIVRASSNGGTAQLRIRSEGPTVVSLKAGTMMRVRQLA